MKAVIHHVGETMNAQVAILLPERESLKIGAGPGDFSLGEKEISVALWTFRNGQMAGRGTETLSSAGLLYLPLQTHMAMELEPALPARRPWPRASASGLEKRNRHSFNETERLERSLSQLDSHDLRTPLSSITGALSSLKDEGKLFVGAESRRELIDLAAKKRKNEPFCHQPSGYHPPRGGSAENQERTL